MMKHEFEKLARTYELKPNGIQKSFYGKAKVIVNEHGDETLYSYDTPIMTRYGDSNFYIRHWYGWSETTGRHIAAFAGMDQATFEDLPTKLSEFRKNLLERVRLGSSSDED